MTRTPLIRRATEFAGRNLRWIVAALAIAVVLLLVALPLVFANADAFYARYESLSGSGASLGSSSHAGIACTRCHVDPRGTVVHDLAFAGDFYASIAGNRKAPLFLKFDKPPRSACFACHSRDWSMDATRTGKVPHPAHLRVSTETRDCVQCHKWQAHEEQAMQKHKEMPFSGVCVAYGCHVGFKQANECANCHHTLGKADWKLDHPKVVQTAGANGCLERCHGIDQCRQCHTTGKTPTVNGPAVQAGMQEIQTLHVQKTWLALHGTIALKDRAQCEKCHVSDSECKACHARRPAFHGPQSTWIGTHKNFAKDKRRCYECHQSTWCDACHKQFKEMR